MVRPGLRERYFLQFGWWRRMMRAEADGKFLPEAHRDGVINHANAVAGLPWSMVYHPLCSVEAMLTVCSGGCN